MGVGTVRWDGANLLAADEVLIQSRVGIGRKESLLRVHPPFRRLDVTREIALGFRLQWLRPKHCRERETQIDPAERPAS